MPDALKDRPPPPSLAADFYIQAFRLLSAFRQPGLNGLSALSYSDLSSYAKTIELNHSQELLFIEILAAMDQAYLSAMNEKMAPNQ